MRLKLSSQWICRTWCTKGKHPNSGLWCPNLIYGYPSICRGKQTMVTTTTDHSTMSGKRYRLQFCNWSIVGFRENSTNSGTPFWACWHNVDTWPCDFGNGKSKKSKCRSVGINDLTLGGRAWGTMVPHLVRHFYSVSVKKFQAGCVLWRVMKTWKFKDSQVGVSRQPETVYTSSG